MTIKSTTKLKKWLLALTLSITLSCSYHYSVNNIQTNQLAHETLLNACTTLKSNLPLSHSSHPCNTIYMPNKSWWAWFSGESKSTHRQFLDLIELIHYSFN